VGTCSPGELVTINGIVKASNLEESGSGKTNRDKATYVMYINVNSITSRTNSANNYTSNNKDNTLSTSSTDDLNNTSLNNTTSATGSSNELEFSKIDLEFFNTIKDNNNYPFKTIVNSLCPSIFGHELVKAGLVLGLFGGSKRGNDANDVAVRSDVHVLVVGDPGLGKV
jgi:DNA helicase MCM8